MGQNTHTYTHTHTCTHIKIVVVVVVGAERQELTADPPCVFMMALMFNVSRSLMPSVEGVSKHMCVHVCAWVCEKEGPCEAVRCLCLSFLLTPFPPLSAAGISISLTRLEHFSCSPRVLLLPSPLSPFRCTASVAVYLLCPQGKTQLTLYTNIHSAIISNLFHTHSGLYPF